MAEILLNIQINADGLLESDLKAFQTELAKEVEKAMDDVGEDMRDALAQHIETDVYDKFSPREYERRGDDGGLIAQARTAKIYNHGAGVTMEYKPDGSHPKESEWREHGVVPAHGDDLIGRIEKWNPRYSFPPRKRRLPKRPFWQKFVSEMVDDGMLEHFFANAMRRQGEEITEDGQITREEKDGNY